MKNSLRVDINGTGKKEAGTDWRFGENSGASSPGHYRYSSMYIEEGPQGGQFDNVYSVEGILGHVCIQ